MFDYRDLKVVDLIYSVNTLSEMQPHILFDYQHDVVKLQSLG